MKNFLSIFLKSSNTFEGEEKGEEVVLLLRRHVVVVYIHLIFLLIPSFIPIILGLLFSSYLKQYNLIAVFLFLCTIFYTVLWFMTFYVLTMYTLDVWIVTNRRIIDSNQDGLFRRTISELYLYRIQDISVKTRGVVQTLFKFGDVEVQTAGTENKFIFLEIPNPEKVKDQVMSQLKKGHHGEPNIRN